MNVVSGIVTIYGLVVLGALGFDRRGVFRVGFLLKEAFKNGDLWVKLPLLRISCQNLFGELSKICSVVPMRVFLFI